MLDAERKKMKPIDIVITTWKREWMTKACIEAIDKNTQTPHRLIVIDNGSNNEFASIFLQERADIYVKLDKNYGLEYAKNIAMNFVESPVFISMDNDVLPYKYEPDWLVQLVDLMGRYPDYGAIALRPQVLVGTNTEMFNTDQEIVAFPHVAGYGRLMRTDLVRAVGAWNDKRPSRGHEEMWIGDKFKQNNWKMGWAVNVRCWHLFGKDGTDTWGYEEGTDSGHNPIWPIPKNDMQEILTNTGINIYE